MNRLFEHTNSTIAYYDAHADEFCAKTVVLDMSQLYAPFLEEIPPGGRILDLGCGSGRDSLAFLQRDYRVVSIDASAAMVAATSKLTGQTAMVVTFDEIPFDTEFDGIWASASLLHVSRRDLGAAFDRLTRALKHGGVLYVSFKYGDAERFEHGRFFNDMNEALLHSYLTNQPQLKLLRNWITDDIRSERSGVRQWLNATVKRCG